MHWPGEMEVQEQAVTPVNPAPPKINIELVITCTCAMRNAALMARLRGKTCSSMIPIAGAASNKVILIPTPNEYTTLPTAHILRWHA